MHPIVPIVAGHLALQTVAGSSALSKEADVVNERANHVLKLAERSEAIFGERAAALSDLAKVGNEAARPGWDGGGASPIDPIAIVLARRFIHALPFGLAMPEFAADPDGAVSLDWMESRNRIFSLSISADHRMAFAWLDGTSKGHGTTQFDGMTIPKRVIDQITDLVGARASIRAA